MRSAQLSISKGVLRGPRLTLWSPISHWSWPEETTPSRRLTPALLLCSPGPHNSLWVSALLGSSRQWDRKNSHELSSKGKFCGFPQSWPRQSWGIQNNTIQPTALSLTITLLRKTVPIRYLSPETALVYFCGPTVTSKSSLLSNPIIPTTVSCLADTVVCAAHSILLSFSQDTRQSAPGSSGIGSC